MHGFDSQLAPINSCDFDDEPGSNAYTLLLIAMGISMAMGMLVRYAESNNQLQYDRRFARVIGGLLRLMMRLLHTSDGDFELDNAENTLLAIGPHRTGWEAIVVASKMSGTPPRFFATDAFNSMPGVSSFLNMFKAILVEAQATKRDDGRSSNARALEDASKKLGEGGCVALFPQGNFAQLGKEPPRIYSGAARLALMNKIPIHVIRLDGFWCLQNPIIPITMRNSIYYRAFLSVMHMNNIQVTLCRKIDFHLLPENEGLSDEEKIEEICAQLYAYYRHTRELTADQISNIGTEIADKKHLLIWNNKVRQDDLQKQLVSLKKEEAALEETTLLSMGAH